MPNIVTVNVTQTVGPTPATLQQTGALISQGATTTSPGTATLLTQYSSLTPILAGAKAITSATWATGGVVTVVCTAPHGITLNDPIYLTLTGITPAGYNGTWLCNATTANNFTFTDQALATNPGSGTGGVYTAEDVAELVAMATTFFAQGSSVSCYVLELGIGSPNDGVAFLTSYIAANPNSAYTPGASGYFYAYLVPRTWDANTNFLAMLQSFQSPTSRTYFFITTTLSSYTAYSNLMKCAFSLIEAPATGIWPANTFTAAAWSSTTGTVTATTTTAHGIAVGQWFTTSGFTPNTYNGIWQALPGTTGTSLVWAYPSYYATPSNPGTVTVQGALQASLYANAGVTATEFGSASAFYNLLAYNPSAANRVAPFAFKYVYGVTPFPTRGNNSLLTTLKNSNVNIIGTGAEGGISTAIILWGTTEDSYDLTYWYSVDWVQINADQFISNAIINGSNNPQNPLYYDQNGINRLQAVAQVVMNNAIAFGLALAPVKVTAVPFATYVSQNPTDYPAGIYRGLAVSYTPNRGFIQIVFYVNVTSFPAAG